MSRFGKSHIAAIIVAAVFIVAVVALNGTQLLGAHPFWATKTALIGGIGGLVIWLVLTLIGLPRKWLITLAFVGLVAGVLSAVLGKQEFAASYAESALAGKFWYLGWFVVVGAATALIAAIAQAVIHRPKA